MNTKRDKPVSRIIEEVIEVLGILRDNIGNHLGDWWWNREVQGKFERKNIIYHHFLEISEAICLCFSVRTLDFLGLSFGNT